VQTLAGLCLLLFIVTVSVVGVRMLLLARRTRRHHELLIGAGMVLVGTVGYPLSFASGFGQSVEHMSVPIWSLSTLISQIGLALIYAFTWQVFRPAEAWGKAIVALGSFFMLASLVGASHTFATAAPEASSLIVARNWLFVGMIGYCGCFLWSAVEGFVQYGMARKRMKLGLADAIVVNRFLLWGVFGLMATGINVASLTGLFLGVDPGQSPLVLIPMGVLGFFASAAIYLAFLPPAAYLDLVRRQKAVAG
jgi:hypothetical protein